MVFLFQTLLMANSGNEVVSFINYLRCSICRGVYVDRKGQSSVEFILIVAFSLLMLIPATILFLNYSADAESTVVNSQTYQMGNELVLTAELIEGVGRESWQTLELVVPQSVNDVWVYEGVSGQLSEVVVNYGNPPSSAVFFTDSILRVNTSVDCSSGCELPVVDGLNKIKVENRGSIIYFGVRI